MKLMSRIFLLLSITVLMVGCKIEVIVPSGGDVQSESSTRDCVGGSLCEHTITDLTFNETFTAVARPGYVFTGWNEGHGFLCGDSVDPVCKISLLGVPEGDSGVNALLASGHIFYVMPHFQFVGADADGDGVLDHLDEDDDNDGILDGDDECPFNSDPDCAIDFIVINGRKWAQPSLFATEGGLSWNVVNAVCPEGVCKGTINGYDITGWTWATATDVAELFYYYHDNREFLTSGLNSWSMKNSPWAPKFFEDGWVPTQQQSYPGYSYKSITGVLYTADPIDRRHQCCGGFAYMEDQVSPPDQNDSMFYDSQHINVQFVVPGRGVWLYKH